MSTEHEEEVEKLKRKLEQALLGFRGEGKKGLRRGRCLSAEVVEKGLWAVNLKEESVHFTGEWVRYDAGKLHWAHQFPSH